MKISIRALALILSCSIIFLTACATDTSSVTSYYDEFGNYVIDTGGYRTIMIDSLPSNLTYNDNHIALTDVAFYEGVSKYSYTLYVVSTLDLSNLTDQQLHWLTKSDLSVNMYITSDKNDYDFDRANCIGSLYVPEEKILYYVHSSLSYRENRHSFSGSEISLSVDATQEETYVFTSSDGKVSNLHKSEGLHYNATIDANLPMPTDIPEPLYSRFVD